VRARVVSLVVCTCLAGCAPLPGTDLELPQPGSVRLWTVAWIATVVIDDPEIGDAGDRARLEEALTLSLMGYIAETRYFTRVNRLPGPVAPGEYVLRFSFTRYRVDVDAYAGAVTSDVSAELVIEDSERKALSLASESRTDSYPSDGQMAESTRQNAARSRTALVEAVLAAAVRGLPQ